MTPIRGSGYPDMLFPVARKASGKYRGEEGHPLLTGRLPP